MIDRIDRSIVSRESKRKESERSDAGAERERDSF